MSLDGAVGTHARSRGTQPQPPRHVRFVGVWTSQAVAVASNNADDERGDIAAAPRVAAKFAQEMLGRLHEPSGEFEQSLRAAARSRLRARQVSRVASRKLKDRRRQGSPAS